MSALGVRGAQVLVAGTPAQVRAAVTAAEPFRGDLLARGVLVAEVPVFDAAVGAAAAAPATHAPAPVAVDTEAAAGPADADVRRAARLGCLRAVPALGARCAPGGGSVSGVRLDGQPATLTVARAPRWRAEAVRAEEWRAWFMEQAGLAAAGTERGLYVSLRLDGRVRGSGVGAPPWERIVAQLPPTDGAHPRAAPCAPPAALPALSQSLCRARGGWGGSLFTKARCARRTAPAALPVTETGAWCKG